MDPSPVLFGVLLTLVLLFFVIFAKVYCFRSTTTTNDSGNGRKHKDSNICKHDAMKVGKAFINKKAFNDF